MSARRLLSAMLLILLPLGCQGLGRSGPRLPAPGAPVIVIDPGHPSDVSAGDVVQNGTTEVHVAWTVAQRLETALREQGYRVLMTKSREGEVVSNVQRARIANAAGASLLVRLHCDASTESGFALYAPDRQGTAQGVSGPSPWVIERSQAAARALHRGMARHLRGHLRDGGVRGDSRTYVGARQGALTGSIFSEVPVVTIEMVVLSNPADAAFIQSAEGRERMVRAIAAGVAEAVPPPAARGGR